MSNPTLSAVLQDHRKDLAGATESLLSRDYAKAAATLAAVAATVVTGHPELAILAPLAAAGARGAFASAADAQMRQQMEAFEREDERRAFAGQVGEVLAEMLDEVVVQVAKIHHRTAAQAGAQVEGVREELKTFRETFARALPREVAVSIDAMEVAEGATGIRMTADPAKSVFLKLMVVKGSGTTGLVC